MRPITERALAQRIRRALAHEALSLHKCSPRSRWHRDLGDYYIVDSRNYIVAQHRSLEALGLELGVLHADEPVVEAST